MNNLRLLIVDDEPLIRLGIRNDVSSLPGVQVAGECASVAEAVQAIRTQELDLVLLDVQMPDGTGFDVIREVGANRMPAVIFVTAFDSYALRAFEVHAVDYLLKPFDDIRLREAVERARQHLPKRDDLLRQLEVLLETREARWPQRLVVRNGDRFDLVLVEAIDWIESANNYTILHCGTVQHVFTENLAGMERLLDPAHFARVHRGHIVNLMRIVAAQSMPGGVFELELKGGVRLNTGRQFSDRIRKMLKAGG